MQEQMPTVWRRWKDQKAPDPTRITSWPLPRMTINATAPFIKKYNVSVKMFISISICDVFFLNKEHTSRTKTHNPSPPKKKKQKSPTPSPHYSSYTHLPAIAAKRGLKVWNFQARTRWFDSEPPYSGRKCDLVPSNRWLPMYLQWGTCSKLQFYIISSNLNLLAKTWSVRVLMGVHGWLCVFNKLSSFVGIYLPTAF